MRVDRRFEEETTRLMSLETCPLAAYQQLGEREEETRERGREGERGGERGRKGGEGGERGREGERGGERGREGGERETKRVNDPDDDDDSTFLCHVNNILYSFLQTISSCHKTIP